MCVGLRTPRSLWLRIQICQGPGRKGDGADGGLGWGEAFGDGVGRLSFGEGAYAQEMVALDPGVALTGGVGLGQVTETLSVGLQDPSLPC